MFGTHVKLMRWFIGIVGGTLIALWVALHLLSRAPILQQKLIATLNDNMDADVELQSFDVRAFPDLRIHGDNLKLRLKNQRNISPFIEVRHFEVAGGVFGLFRHQRRFTSVDLEGLVITIPPRTPNDKEAGAKAAGTVTGPVLIEHITARDAKLVIVPNNPQKDPKVWAIHNLEMESVGFNRSMPFIATLTNPIPAGEIATKGTFGPWVKRDPGNTPLSGHYSFDRADLATIDGIGGILKSIGEFSGRLEEIDVRGHTSTPDFRLDVGGTPVPLETDFHAVVDGTNGNTYLKQVNAKLQDTPIDARGAVESHPGVHGRTVNVAVTIKDGKIQDVLKLAIQSAKPVMLGRLGLQAKLLLPPGKKKVVDRLELDGHFTLHQTHFTDPDVHGQLVTLSRHGQGKKPEEPMGKIESEMEGKFVLRDGALGLDPFSFSLPGATVQLSGVYGLRSQQVDFAGEFAMDAPVSKAIGDGGIKGILLKPFDPIFRKDGKGTVVPITIQGPREHPKFGVEWKKVLK